MKFDDTIPRETGYYWVKIGSSDWQVAEVIESERINAPSLWYAFGCGWEVPLDFRYNDVHTVLWGKKLVQP